MRVESIEKMPRGGKYRVSFDTGGELSLSKEIIVDFALRRNDEISNDVYSRLTDEQSYRDAYFAAARLLNYRMRTREELAQRLKKKGFSQPTVDKVIAKLSEIGFIDDAHFAEIFVASRISSKPVGRRELERKLREKGIPKEAAARAVSSISDDETQLRLASEAAGKKLRSIRKVEPKKRRDKLIAFLARRGFEWDIIKKVVRKTFGGDKDAVDL